MKTYHLICLCFIVLSRPLISARSVRIPKRGLSSRLSMNEECKLEPIYWCQNSTTARLCNKYEHCLQTAWPQRRLSADKRPLCKLCKHVVNIGKAFLESPTYQEMSQVMSEKGCNLIRNQIFALLCVALSKLIPLTMRLIDLLIHPQATCFLFCVLDHARSSTDFQKVVE